MTEYKVILADPAWHYDDKGQSGSGTNSGAEQNYDVMSVEDMKRLEVEKCSDRDSVFFMWTTGPQMPRAIELMEAWGFTYKTVAFVWIKTATKARSTKEARAVLRKRGLVRNAIAEIVVGLQPVLQPSFYMGQGSYSRANAEYVLVGRRGKGCARLDKGVRCEVFAPPPTDENGKRIHSAKPPEVMRRIERLYGDVPRLEMFARASAPGWDAWGNEAPNGLPLSLLDPAQREDVRGKGSS